MVLSYGSGMAGEYPMPWVCSSALTAYAFKVSLPPYSTARSALLGFAPGVQTTRAGERCNRTQLPS
jgi:hypothetical protein